MTQSHSNQVYEVNFDGLVGPSHHYAGLSAGNIASEKNAMAVANPKAAALQGLEKMLSLHQLGIKQGVLIPHLRPNLAVLRAIGFSGSDEKIMETAWRDAPEIASKCYSASPMWCANAATVSPATDTGDGRTHFTAANLCRMFHRSYESEFTSSLLGAMFSNERYFAHHPPLPSGHHFGDEGAANHTRLCIDHGSEGLGFFVYGEAVFDKLAPRPTKYPARQSREASEAIARSHGLKSEKTVFAQQNPDVIDAGVFHNDVIAVGSCNLLFYHEEAFLNSEAVLDELRNKFDHDSFYPLCVKSEDVSVQDAIDTYLFNTQLINVSKDDQANDFMIVAPTECQEHPRVSRYLEEVVNSDAPISKIEYRNLRESMKNGGGPACLRLRVALSETQINSIQPRVMMNEALYNDLVIWVNKHYRDRLAFDDLRDPQLLAEIKDAAAELESLLGLEGIYPI